MVQAGYIFIVGLPRTGTTLTRNILNCSEHIGLGGESHFFADTRRIRFWINHDFRHQLARVGNIASDDGAVKAVDYIYSIRKNNFWGKIAKNIDREEFLRALLSSDRSDRALLDIALSFHCNDKLLRGEKTPAHIYSVSTLLKWFPNAKIIHTFRDPRAVFVSQKKKYEKRNLLGVEASIRKMGLVFDLYSSYRIISSWLRVIELHYEYQQRYSGQYYLSRYEDLIGEPQSSLQNLCDFLGVEFTEAMMQQTSVNSSFVARNQKQGFDTQAIDRWRNHLHPIIRRWFALWCKKYFLEFGYQP